MLFFCYSFDFYHTFVKWPRICLECHMYILVLLHLLFKVEQQIGRSLLLVNMSKSDLKKKLIVSFNWNIS